MTRLPQDNLDRLLAGHLAGKLDAQRGRAVAAFRKHLQNAPLPDRHAVLSAQDSALSPVRLFPRIVAYGVPSLLAACLALIVTIYFAQLPPRGINPGPGAGLAAGQPAQPQMDEIVLTRNLDGGTATLENEPGGPTPVRIIRQQTLRHAEWFDPQEKATYTVTQPVEKVGYVQIQPY